jgi:hypothetical protein
VVGYYKHGKEPPDSIECAKFLDSLRHYSILKKVSVPEF